MNKVTPELPRYLQAAALLVDNCAEQLYELAHAPTAEQRKRTLVACKLAKESIEEIVKMIEPRASSLEPE